jgi:hypothetical protein
LREPRSIARRNDVVVVDGIYDNWEGVRAIASRQEFIIRQSNYPGFRSIVSADTHDLDRVIESLVCPGIFPSPSGQALFSMMNRSSDFTASQSVPHADLHVPISGLIYLNSESECIGGTSFFRHRRTGLGAFPRTVREAEAAAIRGGYGDVSEMLDELRGCQPGPSIYEPGALSDWELVQTIDMKSNRLLLFDAWLFHAPVGIELFGCNERGPRITQNLFLMAEFEWPSAGVVSFRQ